MSDIDKIDLAAIDLGESARPRTFAEDEMVLCEDCLRANPPTRANCLYCGAQLAVKTPGSAPTVDASPVPVAAETGFYVVARANELDESACESVAAKLQTKPVDVLAAIKGGASLPLRLSSRAEAQALIEELKSLGVDATVVGAEDPGFAATPKKIRALEFSDSGIAGVTVSSGERLEETWDGLVLIVTGRLQSTNVEDVVRRKRGGQRPLERRELMNDETICDLHCRTSPDSWRIIAGSFDFSCLGSQKRITTFENFRSLIDLLRERAPNVVVDDSFHAARAFLANLWPLETNTRNGGWRRSGAGKVDMSTVTTTDNETQFNNYSRLLRALRMRAE